MRINPPPPSDTPTPEEMRERANLRNKAKRQTKEPRKQSAKTKPASKKKSRTKGTRKAATRPAATNTNPLERTFSVSPRIKLTDEQKKKIATLKSEKGPGIEAAVKDLEAARAELQRQNKEARAAVLEVLTPEQRSQMAKSGSAKGKKKAAKKR